METHISPENAKLVEMADKALADYSESLAKQLAPKETSNPDLYFKRIEEAKRLYLSDPMRNRLIKLVANIHALCVTQYLVDPARHVRKG